jgi:hypothetical protein
MDNLLIDKDVHLANQTILSRYIVCWVALVIADIWIHARPFTGSDESATPDTLDQTNYSSYRKIE